MDCSTPGLPARHHLPKFTQVHVHCVREPAVSSSEALFSFCPQSFPVSGTIPVTQLFTSDNQNTRVSASASVLPVSIQCWFLLRLTSLISLLSRGLSEVFSSTTVWRGKFFGVPPSYSSALTTVCDHWEVHSLDYTDLCQQSRVSVFQHTV